MDAEAPTPVSRRRRIDLVQLPRASRPFRQHHRRVGVTGGIDGRTLVYVKGGAAWLTSRFDVALNAFDERAPAETYGTKWGGPPARR